MAITMIAAAAEKVAVPVRDCPENLTFQSLAARSCLLATPQERTVSDARLASVKPQLVELAMRPEIWLAEISGFYPAPRPFSFFGWPSLWPIFLHLSSSWRLLTWTLRKQIWKI